MFSLTHHATSGVVRSLTPYRAYGAKLPHAPKERPYKKRHSFSFPLTAPQERFIIPSMGKLNILKSGYEGKVGQTYGVAKKGRYIAKAIPFSHTPHNYSQTTAKDEFIGLNRVASRVVKKMWSYLGLSDKTMYRNNALCQEWKNALKGDRFTIENLKEVLSQEGALRIDTIKYDPQLFTFAYSANEVNPDEQSSNQIIYLAIITNRQITKADTTGRGNSVLLSSVFDYIDFAYFQVWAFKAVPGLKKWQLKGLSISDPIFVIIVNEVFFASRWRWQRVPFVIDEVLYLPPEPSRIEDEILYLR